MMRRFFAVVAVGAAMMAGCRAPEESQPGGANGEPALDTTIRINLGAEPKTLDPNLADDVATNKVMHGLMEPLVWLDRDINPQPGVAESWSHDEDYTHWTFNLRTDARWHNGDPVTAHDFKFSVERICTPSTTAPYAQIVYGFLDGGQEFYEAGGTDAGLTLDAVKVIDDHTLEFTMDYPAPFFLTMVAYATWLPLHRPTVEEHGTDWSLSAETYVGNGPFRMVEYRPRDQIVLEKADSYWDAAAIFWDRVELYMIEDINTENQAFQTRSLDVTEGVSPAELERWKTRPEYRNVPGLAKYYVVFNTQEAPFDNRLVRQAFSKAIDRELIVERITRGGELVSEGFIPHGMPSPQEGKTYRDVAANLIGDMDVEEANRLLAEAGYPGGEGLPSVTYLYNTSDTHKLIGEQLQDMWRRAFDVDVRLQNAEWGIVQQSILRGDFQFARGSWIADFADPLNFLEIFQAGNAKNAPKLDNERYNELVDLARFEKDPLQREQYFIEAERILVEEEAAIAPLYTYNLNFLVQTDIDGLYANPLANMTWPRSRRVAE